MQARDLDAPTSGDIHIGDRLVNALAPAERKIAMVFQSYALYPHMDVRKNMTFGLKFTGVAPAERQRRVSEAATSNGSRTMTIAQSWSPVTCRHNGRRIEIRGSFNRKR